MSYLYATSAAATAPGANAYPHSPYAATTPVMPPHSPYVGAGQPQAIAYPQTTGSTFATTATSTYPGQVTHGVQPAPMPGQTYLPSGGQLTLGSTVTSPTTPAQPSQPFMANVTPGAVTYTTTTDALGRVTYHHFRAEPATYRSPQGVTYTGIQWVPTETSSSPPVGVAPAGPDVLASFRGQIPTAAGTIPQGVMSTPSNPGLGLDYRDDAATEREERRRRKEEKKRNAAWEAERLARERAEDKDIRRARERDAELERASRMRRPSYGGGLNVNASAYERERSRVRGGDTLRDREERELERRMGELDVGDRGGYYTGDYSAPAPGTRSRRQSMSAAAAGGGGIYDNPAYERDNEEYGSYNNRKRAPSRRRSVIYADAQQSLDPYGTTEGIRPASIYGAPTRSRPNSVYAAERSPYRRDASPLQPTLGPDGVDVYPTGHILAGQPVSSSGFASSRNPSPNLRPVQYGGGLGAASPRIGGGLDRGLSPRIGAGVIPGASPRMGGGVPLAGAGGYGGYGAAPQGELLATPDAFNRPINRAQSFTPFKDVRVQEMDELLEDIIHPMPAVLGTHDVLPEDWGRLMHDIMLAWKGRLPLPADKPTKRSDLVIDLLDLWNTMFFFPRIVELVLYKGRTCKSGPGANLPEARLSPEQLLAPGELSDSEGESEEESEDEFADQAQAHHQYGPGAYGSQGRRHGHSQRREMARAQRRKQRIEEKVQREMELNKRYTLWLRYVEPRERDY